MQKEELKFENSTVLEGMTSINALLNGQKSGINDRKIIKILYDSAKENKNIKTLNFLRHRAEEMNFEIIKSDEKEISSLCLGNSHGGIIAVCTLRTLPPLNSDSIISKGFYVMIEGIEDPYNFGYALRSLYASGVDGVILPMRNWMGASGVVSRSSAGASEMLTVFTAESDVCADIFKSKGYKVVAADERTDTYVCNANLKKPILLIVGGEKRGISRKLLDKCDELVKIDYARDFKASLSAASAATILGYEVMIKNK